MNKEVLIVSGARTPFCAWAYGKNGAGAPGGALKDKDPFDLGAAALVEALRRAGRAPAELRFVAFGNMYQSGAHGCYGARYVTHRAGCPPEVPGIAVNLACGTGLAAVDSAASVIREGHADLVAAVGADAPSRLRKDVFVPSFTDLSCGRHIAKTAEERAAEAALDRETQDAWALRSHRRAADARARLAEEIVAVGAATQDDAVKTAATAETFASAELLFTDGPRTVTHANTHGIVDGGAALVFASAAATKGPVLGRLASTALVGLSPERMAYAAVPAARKALEAAGWKGAEVDLWEVNETFAAQTLLDQRELEIPEDRLNVNGGAIALGHPFGATGVRLVHTLLLELKRRGKKKGVAAISVGGGQGVAACVEAA
ncbi:MAG: thiolase family protein [Elusimicrobiota bacterium]|nr:thiolase family protein [Elusimicrobiota bacterium]